MFAAEFAAGESGAFGRVHLFEGAFDIENMTAIGVARPTRNNDIVFGRLAATSEGNHMIHCQFGLAEFAPAMLTNARADLLAPPLTLT